MKKALSIFLAMALMVSSLAVSTVALADSSSVKVQYSVCDGGEFTLEPTDITVTADLSNKYANQIGYNDSSSQPTILDATIAAHIEMFGEDFMDYAPLTISSSGWVLASFGEATPAASYRLNGAMDDGNYNYYDMNTTISNGDYVEYMFYQDSTYYSDVYTSFNTRNVQTKSNEAFELTLYAEGYDSSWNLVTAPAANVTVTVDGKEYGTTDQDGNIEITLGTIGNHIVSAMGTYNYSYIFNPYCAVNVSTDLSAYVEKQMQSASDYLFSSKTSFGTAEAVDFLTYLKSGYDVPTATKNSFVNAVKENLDNNSGKLINAYGSEDLGLYAAAISSLKVLGYDPTSFNGYNLVLAFESLDANQISNPYYYRVAIEAANDDFAKKLCTQFITDYYTMGSGMNYYGFSCDNTATLLTAIAKYASDYKEVVNDAKAVLASYKTDGGAFYNAAYGTDANTDSTALSMMAFAAIGDIDTAFDYYKDLTENFESTTGLFTYYGEVSAYSTKDSLIALEYFYNSVIANSYEHPTEVIKTTSTKATTSKDGNVTKKCVVCGKSSVTTFYAAKTISLSSTTYVYSGKAIKPAVTIKDSKGNKINSSNYSITYSNNTKVGTATVTIKFKNNYSGTVSKTFKINPSKTKITSIAATSKGFAVKWAKQDTQTTGYQIQYSTSSSFKNAKTVTVSKNSTLSKTISKLSGKKRYYVRVRAYKTVSSKNYYSGWSTVKSVTTNK